MDVLLYTHDGAVTTLADLKEAQVDAFSEDKFIRWEALREQCNTIGVRDALDRALR